MKEEYDFTDAIKGKFFIPLENISLPIYLEDDVLNYLTKKIEIQQINKTIKDLVNELLRKDIEILNTLSP
jgi:hypothetical protein